MTATIHVHNLCIHARHGAMEQEAAVGAWFRVDLRARIQCQPHHDSLEHTVNYATIVEVVKAQMHTPSRLLEHLVHRTGTSLMEHFPPIMHLSLSIYKQNPPLSCKCDEIGVEMEFQR